MVNAVQIGNFVQVVNAAQVSAVFEFAVAAVVYIVAAAVVAVPGQQRFQTLQFATRADPLELELVSNTLALRLSTLEAREVPVNVIDRPHL